MRQKILVGPIMLGICCVPSLSYAQNDPAQVWRKIIDDSNAQAARCYDRYLHRKIKRFTSLEQCADKGVEAELRNSGFPEMDIYEWIVASHMAIAERVDRHEITRDEGLAEYRDIQSQAATKEQQRMALAAQQQEIQAQQERLQAQQQALAQREAEEQAREAQLQAVQAQQAAQGEYDRRMALLRFSAAIGQPTQTGSFAEALSNGMAAYGGAPIVSAPPPRPRYPTQTTCFPTGNGITCNSQ